MSYVALYRAYRPQTFSEVAGQKAIIQTLKNAIKLNKVSHAYLFAGPRGTGKTTMAKIMAKALNCETGPTTDPCNECDICKGINKGIIPDVIEIDAASNNGVDEIRKLRDNVKYLPSICRYKVYIIDEVHMLSQGAFNALLKTLEEPPKHVVFILATTEPYKLPTTILSRCQRFDFQAISNVDIVGRLKIVAEKEKINISDQTLSLIANLSEGGMRDALSLFDQVISYSKDNNISSADVLIVSGNVSEEMVLNLLVEISKFKTAESLDILNKILDQGKEISKVISDIMTFLKNILLYKINRIESSSDIYKSNEYITFASSISTSTVYRYLSILNDTLNDVKYTNQKRSFFEISIIKMSDKADDDFNSLERRISYLESIINKMKNMKFDYKEESNKGFSIPKKEDIDKVVLDFDYSKCIDYKEINDVINKGNKELKKKLNSILEDLKNINSLLINATIPCVSEDSIIFTLPLEGSCNRMMKDPNYTELLKEVNKKGNFKKLYFINKSMWNEIVSDWLDKYKSGNNEPTIDKHDIRILKYDKIELEEKDDDLSELFDEELIKEDN